MKLGSYYDKMNTFLAKHVGLAKSKYQKNVSMILKLIQKAVDDIVNRDVCIRSL